MRKLFIVALFFVATAALAAPPAFAPDRKAGEGEGPWTRLIIRGVDARRWHRRAADRAGGHRHRREPHPRSAQRRLSESADQGRAARPKDAVKEIDGTGIWVLPGFVDMHGHSGGEEQGTTAEYVFKLWMANGITSVREPGCGNGVDWCLHERERSAQQRDRRAAALSVRLHQSQQWDGGPIDSPEQARKFAQCVAKKGADGMKILSSGDPVFDPEILSALIDEANKLHLGTTTHLAQMGVARSNIIDAARMGLRGMEHWYGLPEALFTDRTIQDFPRDYNYNDEANRFGEAGRLWKQAAEPAARSGTPSSTSWWRRNSTSIRR